MLSMLFTFPALVTGLVLILTYRSTATYKNGMLFAVMLPADALEHPQIQLIQAHFLKVFKRTWLTMIVTFLPLYVMNDWFGIQTIYFLIWIITLSIVITLPFRKAMRATLQLKREQDWFVGKKQLIQADLRAAHLKNKGAAPLGLFLIPLSISALLTWWLSTKDNSMIVIGFISILMTVIFWGLVYFILRSKSTLYSQNSEINVALNQAKRRSLSYLFLFLAIVESIHIFLVAILTLNEIDAMFEVWLTLVVMFSIVPIGIILGVYNSIRSRERQILALDEHPIYSDDDEYWANGFTYHNPYDKSLLVPKRVGIGETINTGTTAGKIIMGGVLGLLVAVVVGTSFLLVRSELTSPTLEVIEQQQISIHYPMYSFAFPIADIEEISLVEDYPSGIKANGEATNKHARGHFRLKEIGKARLYVFKNNPPYIQLRLTDQYVFYNDINPAVTEALYHELEQMVDSNN